MYKPIELYSSIAKAQDLNPGVASSSLTFGMLTVNFPTGTGSFCVH